MKNIFKYSFAAMASLVLASCNGDYDDWASPQSYTQEEAAAAYQISMSAGSGATATMPVSDDVLHLATLTAGSDEVAGFTIRSANVKVNDDVTFELPVTMIGNDVTASADELENRLQEAMNSRANQSYVLNLVIDASANMKNGDAIFIEELTSTINFTTNATPAIDQKGYFLLGNFEENGAGWDLKAPVWMVDNGDNTFSAIVNTTSETENWFKFYEGSHYSADSWDEVNLGQMGCKVNGSKAMSDVIVWSGDKFGVETPVIEGKGQFKVTIDMKNMTYKVVRQAVNYYIIGGPNDWKESAVNKTLKFNQPNIEESIYSIIFPAVEGSDTWFAIGDDKSCAAIADEDNWKLLWGTTSGNGEQGTSGTLKRRTELSDDGSFKVPAGAKFIQVKLNMSDYTYEVKTLDFSEFIYVPGNAQKYNTSAPGMPEWGWTPSLAPALRSANFNGVYEGFAYMDGEFKFTKERDWDHGEYNYDTFATYDAIFTGEAGSGGNINCTATGYYKLVADVANGSLTATKLTWGLVGPATAGGWDAAQYTVMNYNMADDCWEVTTDLAADEFKFTTNGTWDINLGGSVDDLSEGAGNLSIAVAGNYTIKLYPSRSMSDKMYCTITKN